MTEKKLLAPRTVTIESNLKAFGLDKGISDGTTVSVTYDVPPDTTRPEFTRLVLEEKERLDKLALYMEHAKGSVENDFLSRRKAQIERGYDKLLKRTADDVDTEG